MVSSALPLSFYRHEDVLHLAKALLGKFLMTKENDLVTGGMIVETEAYRGPDDRASHAFGGKRTPRNDALYGHGGTAYVYQCYGIHFLFNAVTYEPGYPHAVLIRALAPETGIEEMLRRRHMTSLARSLTAGPAVLCQALGITKRHNQMPLDSSSLWIEDRGITVSPKKIFASPRVGVDYAGPDAKLPWRFRLKDNPWTSPAR